MLGLLGGLVGRAAIGGALGGAMASRPRPILNALMSNRPRGSSAQPSSQRQQAAPPQQQASEDPQKQQQPQQQQQSAPQRQDQPVQQAGQAPPLVNDLSSSLRSRAPSPPVTGGLLDAPPPVVQESDPLTGKPGAPSVVNRDGGPMPVARDATQTFGNVPTPPQAQAPDVKVDIQEMPPRRYFEQQDGWPTQPITFENAKYSTSQGFEMQPAGPPSAYAPQFSYMRR